MTDIIKPMIYPSLCYSNNNSTMNKTVGEEVETLESLGYELLKENTSIRLLVEIVGMTDLKDRSERKQDKLQQYPRVKNVSPPSSPEKSKKAKKSCNTHCVVSFNDIVIHTTKTIHKDKNPIFDITSQSMFLFCTQAKDLVSSDGLKFLVYDEVDVDMMMSLPSLTATSRSQLVGEVTVKPSDILGNCNETRLEYELSTRREDDNMMLLLGQQQPQTSQGKIALRFRVATSYDIKFLEQLNRNAIAPPKSSKHLASDKTAPASIGTQMKSLKNVWSPNAINESLTKIRIKPSPDPLRKKQTAFMSKEDIRNEYRKPSTNWIETGSKSGSLGRIYLEILRCEGLPNMDLGGVIGNLTDSFICAVHEDSMLETNVINDELDPIWMPWTRRAFIFNMVHPLSALYLSVSDHDLGPLGHEGIGRVVLNMNNFHRDTMYTLQYKLYPSSNLLERSESFGTITIRLRLEIDDERKYLLASYTDPPKFHVNVTHETSLSAARYTCHGKYEDDKFDLNVIKSYVWEFFYYKDMISYYIGDALRSLVFWRGQYKLKGYDLPTHSAIAFVVSVHLVEHLHLVLPSIFFLIAWVMIAGMSTRSIHPSPWYQCKSFSHYLQILLRGQSSTAASTATTSTKHNIAYRERAEEAEAYVKAWERRLEEDLEKSNKAYELQLELDAIANEVIETKTEGNKFDIYASLLPIALRMQQRLSGYCYSCRKIKSILNWDESLISFWVTFYSLAIGISLLIIPWTFILHWTLRISVWTFLGPWMMIVDKYLVNKDRSNEDLLYEFQEKSKLARLKGEENSKRKALRSLLYGAYSVNVPTRNVALHHDLPLSESAAHGIEANSQSKYPSPHKSNNTIAFVPGQHLEGNMILRQCGDKKLDEETQHLSKSKFQLSALKRIALVTPEEKRLHEENNKKELLMMQTRSTTTAFTTHNGVATNNGKGDMIRSASGEDEEEEFIYEDDIEVYGTICSASSMDRSYKWGVDMIQHGSELEVISRDDASLTETENTTTATTKTIGVSNSSSSTGLAVVKERHSLQRCDENEQEELVLKKKKKQHNHNSVQPSVYRINNSSFHDARDEDEVEEQGLEIINYHCHSTTTNGTYNNNITSMENDNATNNSTSLSCLYHSPTSREVDIAFYIKNK